jgi:hypothetical protein
VITHLTDGTRVRLREIRPDHKDLVIAARLTDGGHDHGVHELVAEPAA